MASRLANSIIVALFLAFLHCEWALKVEFALAFKLAHRSERADDPVAPCLLATVSVGIVIVPAVPVVTIRLRPICCLVVFGLTNAI